MSIFSLWNAYSLKFKKYTTLKRNQLVITGLVMLLNCFSWQKVNACDFLQEPLDSFVDIYDTKNGKNCEIFKPRKRMFNSWVFSFKNFSKYLISKRKFKKMFLRNGRKYFWKKNNKCVPVGEFLEKINEIERLGLKNNKWNLGHVMLSKINLVRISNSFLFTCKDKLYMKDLPVFIESIENNLKSNAEVQFSASVINLYPEIREIYSFRTLVPLDLAKGFVLNNFANNSGLKTSKHLKASQKNIGYYCKRNLRESYKYSIECTSNVAKKNISQKRKNKKFKLNRYNLFLNQKLVSRVVKIVLVKNRLKKRLSGRSFIVNRHIKAMNIKRKIAGKVNVHSVSKKNAKKKLKIRFSIHAKNIFSFVECSQVINGSVFSKKRLDKSNRLKFGINRYKTTYSTIANSFRSFPFPNIKSNKKSYIQEISFNSRESFNIHSLNRAKKIFINKRIEHKLNFTDISRINLTSVKLNRNCIKKKIIGIDIINLPEFFSKNIQSNKNYNYNKEKEDVFFSHSKRFSLFNDIGSLNFIGKAFWFGKEVPKSFYESYRYYSKSSSLGNLDAQFNSVELHFYGKGVPRNKRRSFLLSNSSLKRGHNRSLLNAAILLRKGIQVHNDSFRSFTYIKKFNNLSFRRRKKNKRSKKKQKNCKSNVTFLATKEPTEFCFGRCFVESLTRHSHLFLSGFMCQKCFLIGFALKNFNKAANQGSFLSGLKLAEALQENKQLFLSFRIAKDYFDFNSPWKNFYFTFKYLTGGGLSVNFLPNFTHLSGKSCDHFDFFRNSLTFIGKILSIIEILLFYIKFLFSFEYINLFTI
nr:sel1 repeat domain-containing protein [Cryptomonas sp.]